MRAHYASRLRLWLDIPAIAVTVIAGAYLWRYTSFHWLSLASIGVSAILVLILVMAFVVIPPFAFRREPKFRDEYSLTFSAECIHFKTQHIDSKLEWSIYSQALIVAHSYVLYHGTGSFSVIPKRVLQNIDQQRSFEQLLVQHIPKIVTN
jgi:hypothetical protein